jgi:hypothetical protein
MGLKMTLLMLAVGACGLVWAAAPAHAQTPEPTATIAVTSSAPVSPTAAVSETWYLLTDQGGAFSMQFPSTWTASQVERGRIALEGLDSEIISVMVLTGTTGSPEDLVDRWVKTLAPSWEQLGEKVVEDQRGNWDRGLSGAYARVATVNPSGQNEELMLVSPASDGRVIAVSDGQPGMMLTEANLARLEHILTSLRLSARLDQPLSASAPATTQKLGGQGPQAQTSSVKLVAGQAIFRLTHDGQQRFAIWLLDAQDTRVGFLIDAVGPLKQVYSFAVPRDGDFKFDVTADGAWTIDVQQ